jgi:hypothetical protein
MVAVPVCLDIHRVRGSQSLQMLKKSAIARSHAVQHSLQHTSCVGDHLWVIIYIYAYAFCVGDDLTPSRGSAEQLLGFSRTIIRVQQNTPPPV